MPRDIVEDIRFGQVIQMVPGADRDGRREFAAAQAFEKALELTRMDLFALSGLVRAYAAIGEQGKASEMMGRLLAREHPAEADLVVPLPDSGVPAAIGYSLDYAA